MQHTIGSLLHELTIDRISPSLAGVAVSGVHDDSRMVRPGGVFVAVRGAAADGRAFAADAVARGAVAAAGEGESPAAGLPWIRVADARRVLALLAARWHAGEAPTTLGMKLLGITGTNGKTTTAHMTREILRAAGVRCALLGTVQVDVCSRAFTADMTTPAPVQLLGHLKEAADAGASAAVMEVSSHAVEQRRVDGLRFAAAAFTNLTQDHLDYHKTMEAYAQAKARLFTLLDAGATAVVNGDDPAHKAMIAGTRARIVTYGTSERGEISATITRDTTGGTLYRMRIEGREVPLENAIPGRHNVYNAMAAAGLALAAGAPIGAIERGLQAVRNVPGRLQKVPTAREVDIFVDYAHTDDALRNVASVLKPLARGRLIIVFGCGGDRDRGKRPKMARAAADWADAIVVTSDNPRSEDPRGIIADVLAGFSNAERSRVCVEPDRRKAIAAALAGARRGDVVLIAGKGHEDYQIIGRERIHFDDVEEAIRAESAWATAESVTA